MEEIIRIALKLFVKEVLYVRIIPYTYQLSISKALAKGYSIVLEY
jgi:hypothetical protein